jgi:hypothetical protein
MEQAIGKDLESQVTRPAVAEPGKKMMPLQDLVEQDAVEKTAYGKAKQITRPSILGRKFPSPTPDCDAHVSSSSGPVPNNKRPSQFPIL